MAAALLVAMPVAGSPIAAGAEVTPEELEEAEEELLAVRAEVQELTERFEAALTHKERLDASVAALAAQGRELDARARSKRQEVRERAAEMYMEAITSRLSVLVVSSGIADLGTGLSYLEDVATSDQSLIRDVETLEGELRRNLDELEAAVAEQAVAVAELDLATAELNATLERIQSEYNELFAQWQVEEAARRAAEEARRRAEEAARLAAGGGGQSGGGGGGSTAPPVVTSGRTCPVNGFSSFTDTWGAPRSGGRFHKGVDMLAARGTPLVAVEAGTVVRLGSGGLGGITVWLRGNSGDEFYYAHLDSWASGLSAGQSVGAGQALGTVGTTGNAPAGVPHLHWEYHPAGRGAVNPTPLARSLCG